ncbi:hypothetical protein L484_015791 [Morus notabilis]|uniref:Uncharacterized protein n=1 Tax=Morus notabilis TaxID=981085 RepID=W9QK15_9ROSA|nr:hypothetical protein L484_015791 [Morus notabilis]
MLIGWPISVPPYRYRISKAFFENYFLAIISLDKNAMCLPVDNSWPTGTTANNCDYDRNHDGYSSIMLTSIMMQVPINNYRS